MGAGRRGLSRGCRGEGRVSVLIRAGKLAAARASRPVPRRSHYDFSAFDDQELDELAALADIAEAAGGAPVWTEAEVDSEAVMREAEAILSRWRARARRRTPVQSALARTSRPE